jgi:uncharacterized protein YegL
VSSREPHVALSLLALYRAVPPEPRKLLVLARASCVSEGEDVLEAPRPTHLVVALDASGSMDGVKMKSAIATLHALVDELGPADSLGLVTFSTSSQVLLPASIMSATAKQMAHACLGRVKADGGTDLAGAVLEALRVSKKGPRGRRHVIVLTDGYPTSGVRESESILRLLEGAKQDVTSSFFGFGEDVRPELLERLAEVGGGRYHFIPGTEPPVEAFAAELGQQRALFAVDVSLSLTPGQGVSIGYVPSLAEVQSEEGNIHIRMPSLLRGDTRCVVVGIDLGVEAFALEEATPWLRAELQFRSVHDGEGHVARAHFVPVLAAAKGDPVIEVAREFSVQRLSELVYSVTRWTEDLDKEKAALADFVARMGLSSDPQVVAGLAVLARLRQDLADASRSKAAHVAARAAAKGMYDREVTGLGLGTAYAKRHTLLTLERMSKRIGGKDGKGGGELN